MKTVAAQISRLLEAYAFAFAVLLLLVLDASAQVSAPATINGGYPVGINNIAGTTANTSNSATLFGLGLNQGTTFDFSASLSGTGNWSSGLRFNNGSELQTQGKETDLPSNLATYTFQFSETVYGLQFLMDLLDNGDTMTVTFTNKGNPVAISQSEIVATGANVTATANPDGTVYANGPGNNDPEEYWVLNLDLLKGVDRVVFTPTGKNNGSTGNVTLLWSSFAWARPGIALTKGSIFDQGADGETTVGDVITYTYIVTNTGNVPLSIETLLETTFNGSGTVPIPTFVSGTGGSTPGNFIQGTTLTYQASYALTAADLTGGGPINNQASVTAHVPGIAPGVDDVTDLSDSANAGDGGAVGSTTEDDVTQTPIIIRDATLTLQKTVIGGSAADTDWTLEFTGPDSGSGIEGSVHVNSVAIQSGDYTLSETGGASGYTLTDLSCNGTADTSVSVADPTISIAGGESAMCTFTNTADESLAIYKFSVFTSDPNGNSLADVGDVIRYYYVVVNDGLSAISNVSISESHNGTGTFPASPGNETLNNDVSPIGDSIDGAGNGVWGTLGPGDSLLFFEDYVVTQQDLDTLQ